MTSSGRPDTAKGASAAGSPASASIRASKGAASTKGTASAQQPSGGPSRRHEGPRPRAGTGAKAAARSSTGAKVAPPLRKAARQEQRRVRRLEGHRRRRARRSVLWRWRRALYVVGILLVVGIVGVAVIISRVKLPEPATLAQTTYICSSEVTSGCAHGNEVASLRAEIDRELVTYQQIPPIVVSAVLAAEDRDYFRHGGIDPFGIARAVVRDVQSRSGLQGGSTITQQYVKNAFLNQDRTLSRKLREAVLAVKLERARTKEEILTNYLNTIYFGRGAYGVQAASNAYFGHGIEFVGIDYDTPTLSARGLAKAAYLAGLIRSPETDDVYFDPDEAAFRRDSVLDGMVEEGSITPEQATAARALKFKVVDDRANGYVQPRLETADGIQIYYHHAGAEYYVDSVRQWLQSASEPSGCSAEGSGSTPRWTARCRRRRTPPSTVATLPSALPWTACSTIRPIRPAPSSPWTSGDGWWRWWAAGISPSRR